jgi:hypothetical protein
MLPGLGWLLYRSHVRKERCMRKQNRNNIFEKTSSAIDVIIRQALYLSDYISHAQERCTRWHPSNTGTRRRAQNVHLVHQNQSSCPNF